MSVSPPPNHSFSQPVSVCRRAVLFLLLADSILSYTCLFVYEFIRSHEEERHHEQTILNIIQNIKSIDSLACLAHFPMGVGGTFVVSSSLHLSWQLEPSLVISLLYNA